MVEIIQSETFRSWFAGLRDRQVKSIVDARIRRVSLGNFGDIKPLNGPVSELRIDHGPGYRIYITRRGSTLAVLLAGGTKRTQDADIKRALKIASAWKGLA